MTNTTTEPTAAPTRGMWAAWLLTHRGPEHGIPCDMDGEPLNLAESPLRFCIGYLTVDAELDAEDRGLYPPERPLTYVFSRDTHGLPDVGSVPLNIVFPLSIEQAREFLAQIGVDWEGEAIALLPPTARE